MDTIDFFAKISIAEFAIAILIRHTVFLSSHYLFFSKSRLEASAFFFWCPSLGGVFVVITYHKVKEFIFLGEVGWGEF